MSELEIHLLVLAGIWVAVQVADLVLRHFHPRRPDGFDRLTESLAPQLQKVLEQVEKVGQLQAQAAEESAQHARESAQWAREQYGRIRSESDGPPPPRAAPGEPQAVCDAGPAGR